MITRFMACLVLIAGVGLASCAHAQPSLETEFHAATQAMLDAVAPGDRAAFGARLDEAFVHVDETGQRRTRAELLDVIEPLPAGLVGRIEIENFRVQQRGSVAIATYDLQEYLDYHGQPLRSRFRSLDVWVSTENGWRLLAQHVAATLKDPPAIALSAEQVCAYSGVYALTDQITTRVTCAAEGLIANREGREPVRYLAETPDVFFVRGLPRTRRIFLRDAAGAVTGFVDRREGEDILWRRVASAR